MKIELIPRLLAFVFILCASVLTTSAQDNLPELIKRVKPAVVSILTYDSAGEPLMTGSGFFVTNLHVIRGAARVDIKTLDGKGKLHRVTGILDVDEDGDLALMSIDIVGDRPRSSELAASLPDEGEAVFVIGNPLKLEGSVSSGIVSAIREVPIVGSIIQITAGISH